MRYIKPEIEIAEIHAQDVITLSVGDIFGWNEIPEDKKDMVNVGDDGNGNANVDVDADFFN